MYLKELHIKGFRGIKETNLSFNAGVNILIGENNSGKSAIIDALRISLSYGKQWRDIGVSANDFFIDRSNPDSVNLEVAFDLKFEITREEECGWFIEMLAINPKTSDRSLQIHFRYTLDENSEYSRVRWKVWGGENEGQIIPNEVLERFYFIYLEPLRDALKYLRPSKGNKTSQLFSNIVPDPEQRDELANKVKNNLHSDKEWNKVIEQGENSINEHLSQASIRGKKEEIDIDFLPFEFRKLVENLRMQIPVYPKHLLNGDENKQKYFDLSQNGLGSNNVIYTATVLGNLTKKYEVDSESYLSLLIEEPEAHLHPQMQNILFSYLGSLDSKGFQVFVSSHSPTITAKANLNSVIVLQHQGQNTHALSINNSGLSEENRSYLHKFLDVTKAQLFFANGVILVEGIAEALLLPVFANLLDSKEGTKDLMRNGIEIVNINGVAFSHFANLFNSDVPEKRLLSKCSILTDDDTKDGEESSRATSARKLAGNNIKVFLSKVTFEYELYITDKNESILMDVYSSIRPKASKNVKTDGTLEERGDSFLKSVVSNKAKSELAHALAVKLSTDEDARKKFIVPDYIKDSIDWVIAG